MLNFLRRIVDIFFFKKKIFEQDLELHSRALNRSVKLSVLAMPNPAHYPSASYALLLVNDGQDFRQMKFSATLATFHESVKNKKLITIGLHAGDRLQEYGTASRPDYAKRGGKAKAYTQFIIEELIPYLETLFNLSPDPKDRAFAGFSLGALSALDIAWAHPEQFGKVGVFSGSLWWRSKAFDPKAPDANLIMHHIIRTSKKKEGMKFWFQAGTKDEKEDRNNNGVIDSIDDTLSLIDELKKLGYTDQDITYVQVEGGYHNQQTWGEVMPQFLEFLFREEA